ncbi:hypothetical protein SAMN05192563_103975 [Paraburkholderia aspalathi]|uniref:Uncharacterized protein n=1 Tax=Paraburkholderia aspalathi TaxID=1324617 RepID=A0A1I7EP28_9BURK|nr:hypothetical protein SAMN05192563_103975 [Paraburkholderia aspalathi]
MPSSPHPDTNAHAELLTFLVVSQLLMRQVARRWLTVGQVVESTHLWLRSHGDCIDWLERIELAGRAQGLAESMTQIEGVTFKAGALRRAFLGCGRQDYRSPAAARIYSVCVDFVIDRNAARSGARLDSQYAPSGRYHRFRRELPKTRICVINIGRANAIYG